jgi:predicted rRNA methylase YqxC with S4 and FtsJ domains
VEDHVEVEVVEQQQEHVERGVVKLGLGLEEVAEEERSFY